MKIKELCSDERPREKMMSLGPGSLSNAELLSIILRNGTRDCNVLELSNRILSDCGGHLSGIASLGFAGLSAIKGVGGCKALELLAAIEIGRRFMSESGCAGAARVVGPKAVCDILRPMMKGLDHEEGWMLMMSPSMRLIGKRRFSCGTFSAAAADVGDILRRALERKAACIVLSHNHPSGNPRPSPADINFTGELKTAASAFGITLADHVIIADSSYYSFADEMIYEIF